MVNLGTQLEKEGLLYINNQVMAMSDPLLLSICSIYEFGLSKMESHSKICTYCIPLPLPRPQLKTAAFFFLLLQHNHSFENTKLFFLMVYTLSFLVSNQKTKQKKKMLTPTDQIDFPLMELTINDEMKQHSAANCVQLQNVANLRRGSHLDACKSLRIGN